MSASEMPPGSAEWRVWAQGSHKGSGVARTAYRLALTIAPSPACRVADPSALDIIISPLKPVPAVGDALRRPPFGAPRAATGPLLQTERAELPSCLSSYGAPTRHRVLGGVWSRRSWL